MAMPSVNCALNQPALQSSVSRWSSSKHPEEAARGANNGDLTIEFGCHTGEEDCPWWQVDLGAETVIEKIALYNRQQCAYRLRYFSLHMSFDGKRWSRFYKRTDPIEFGKLADDILTVTPADVVIARFLRLQLDYKETLHFRECEVYGRPPTPQDYQRFATLNDPVPRLKVLAAGRTGFFMKISRQSIFVDEGNYTEEVVSAIKQREYLQDRRRSTDKMLLPPDRVLEVGTGIGLVSMVAANRTSPEQVRTFDADHVIIADANRNFMFNQVEAIRASAGILKNRKHFQPAEKMAKSVISRNFWVSPPEIAAVPVFCLEEEIAQHRANVLIIDVAGGEVELLDDANLSSIRLIIMQTSHWAAGVADSLIAGLLRQGFENNQTFSRRGLVVLSREIDRRWISKLRRWLNASRKTAMRIFAPSKLSPVEAVRSNPRKNRKKQKRRKVPASASSPSGQAHR